MPHKPLKQKRKEMINFLLENIIARETKKGGREIDRVGNDIVFTDYNLRTYFIKVISKQADFPYDFEKDPRRFDNDKRKLQAIFSTIKSYIQEKNNEGFIPGFVLLRADTDYSQLKERTEHLVNRGHFTKQKLPSPENRKPGYDSRSLDRLELVLQQFYGHNTENSGKRRVTNKQIYHPELVYFNPKKGVLEVEWFANVANPLNFRLDYCPICRNPNGEKYTHQDCKEDPAYLRHVIKRNEARYSKRIMISRTRRNIDNKCRTRSERGIRFKPTIVGDSKLYMPEKSYIALVK